MLQVFDQAYLGVYKVLDDVLASSAVPPGAKGAMYAIIDGLRSTRTAGEDVNRAERVSIAIHQLEIATRERDQIASQNARDELKSLAVAWLDTRILGGPRPTK